MTTFAELHSQLQDQDTTKPLVFTTVDGEIGAGYHVTELRHSLSTGIDCGGNIETSEDAKLQLLDGQGSTHMTVEKFSSIVQKSLSVMPELRDAPLMVEFGHNNKMLTLMSLGAPEASDQKVVLPLGDARAVCKPAMRNSGVEKAQGGCCGSEDAASEKSSCCGASGAAQEKVACCA